MAVACGSATMPALATRLCTAAGRSVTASVPRLIPISFPHGSLVRNYAAKPVPTKIIYACNACNRKQQKDDSRVVYLKNTVFVQCVGCENIDDDLRWLSSNNSKTEIEDYVREHGIKVRGGPRIR